MTSLVEKISQEVIVESSTYDQKQPFADVLKNIVIFTGKHLCWRLFFIKLKACNFIKKRLQHKCVPVNIVKCLRATFFIEHLRWLLLYGSFKSLSDLLVKMYDQIYIWPKLERKQFSSDFVRMMSSNNDVNRKKWANY